MKILVINAGSSSLKYQLIDMDGEKVLAKGLCERIGIDGVFTHNTSAGKFTKNVDMPNHTVAFKQVEDALLTGEGKVIDDLKEITAIGHRVVQGGPVYDESVIITDKVLSDIEDFASLAPLHNPAHVQGIKAAIDVFGKDVPQAAVFDTSFHQTMPEHIYTFAIPYELSQNYNIRRYGFHGTSHRYVSARCAELLGKPSGEGTKIISCHIGNGASIAAIKDGKVLDTTMGFTPLDGFMMGTRSGTLDPSVVTFLMDKENLSPAEADNLLNKKSGMLGVSGVSSDDRDIVGAMEDGNERAKLAWDMRVYQITKFIGSYIAALGGLDAIIFTAGIGENQIALRKEVLDAFAFYGVKVDDERNNVRGVETLITADDSSVKAFIIPTDEELVIARDTKNLIK